MKKRGCCTKCRLLKDGQCKEGYEPKQGFNSTVYQCSHREMYAKDKKKEDSKKLNVLIELADKVFGNYIRYRDNGICITCDSKFNPADRQLIHAGHYISRARKSVRFDEKNVYAQCRNCNGMQNIQGNGFMLEQLLTKGKLTMQEVNELREKSNKTKKFTPDELQELIRVYMGKLGKMQNNEEKC